MRIAVTGSIAYDYLMRFPGRFKDHFIADSMESVSLSFLVDSMVRQRGGVAANIAYTMRLLGGDPVIFATVGQDFGDYRLWLEDQGLSTDTIIEISDDFTASFFVSTDLDQNQIANFYTGAMAHARRFTLAEQGLIDVDLVIISPNDPVAMMNLADECRSAGVPFAYDPSQQTARLDGDEMRRSLPGARYLMVNEYELAIILKKTGWSREDILERVGCLVVTMGAQGSTIVEGGVTIAVPAAAPDRIAEPTGAGDAYRGGFFAALGAGLSLATAGKVGALCSTYVLEQIGTSNHRFGIDEFTSRYERSFGAEPELAALRSQVEARLVKS